MWTYSGILIEKTKDKYIVYASDDTELMIFADGYGILRDFFIEEYQHHFPEQGLYQVLTGYGRIGDPTDPKFYQIKKINKKLNWDLDDKDSATP